MRVSSHMHLDPNVASNGRGDTEEGNAKLSRSRWQISKPASQTDGPCKNHPLKASDHVRACLMMRNKTFVSRAWRSSHLGGEKKQGRQGQTVSAKRNVETRSACLHATMP